MHWRVNTQDQKEEVGEGERGVWCNLSCFDGMPIDKSQKISMYAFSEIILSIPSGAMQLELFWWNAHCWVPENQHVCIFRNHTVLCPDPQDYLNQAHIRQQNKDIVSVNAYMLADYRPVFGSSHHHTNHVDFFLSVSVTPYYKNKLRGLYNTAMQDAEGEAE